MRDLLQNLRSKLNAHDLMSRLMRGLMLAFVMNVAGFVFGFMAQLVIGRTLGLGGYGVYAYVQAWVSFIAVLCGMGLPYGLLRFIPDYKGKEAWPLVRAVIRYAETRTLTAGLAVSLVGLMVMLAIGGWLDQEFAWTIYAGLLAMPLLVLLRVWCSVLRAFGRIVPSLGSDLPVREGFTFLAVAVFGLGFTAIDSAPVAMLVWTLGTAIGVAISFICWQRQTMPSSWKEPVTILPSTQSHWLQVALMLLVVQSLTMLLRRVDLFVVGMWFDKETLGVYAAANRLAEIMIFPSYVLTAYLAPTISELHSQGAKDVLQKATTLTANIALVSAVIFVLPLLLIPDILLGLFGQDFSQGAMVLRLLALGEFVATTTPFATMMLTMTGHERAAVKLMVAASIGTFLLMMLAASTGAIETVALARSGAIIIIQLSFCWLIHKKVQILPLPLVGAKKASTLLMGSQREGGSAK